MKAITLVELERGCAAFWKDESRDAMYRIACKLVKEGWGNPADVADGLGVVLLTWNEAAYRYGSFDFHELEGFVRRNQAVLNNTVAEGSRVSIAKEKLTPLSRCSPKRSTPWHLPWRSGKLRSEQPKLFTYLRPTSSRSGI